MSASGWYDSLSHGAQEIVDQALHAFAGAAISGLVGGVASIWLDGGLAGLIGAAASSLGGGIREAIQNLGDKRNDTIGNLIDWGVWTLAGIAIGLIVWAVS